MKTSFRRTVLAGAVAIVAMGWSERSHAFDAFDDFSPQFNPTPGNVWSYMYRTGRTGPASLIPADGVSNHANCGTITGLFCWSVYPADDLPMVGKNTLGGILTRGDEKFYIANKSLNLHPFFGGLQAILRFTFPADGNYRINGLIFASDLNNTNGVKAAVELSSVPGNPTCATSLPQWTGYRSLPKPNFIGDTNNGFPISSNGPMKFCKGQTLDIVVDPGDDGDFSFDSVGLKNLTIN